MAMDENRSRMIFLHGGKQGGWIWDELIAALALQAPDMEPPLILDIPGCGAKRGRDTSGLGLDAVIEELAHDVASAGVDRCVFVGHSQAGTVLPRLAVACGAQVDRIVYVTCAGPLEGETIREMLARTAPRAFAGDMPIEARFAAMFCNDMDEAAQTAFLARMGGDEWPAACGERDRNWGYAAAAQIPATYVLALRDQILTPTAQEEFAQQLHAQRIIRIDAGHQPQQTRPHALAEMLLQETRHPCDDR